MGRQFDSICSLSVGWPQIYESSYTQTLSLKASANAFVGTSRNLSKSQTILPNDSSCSSAKTFNKLSHYFKPNFSSTLNFLKLIASTFRWLRLQLFLPMENSSFKFLHQKPCADGVRHAYRFKIFQI